MPRGVTHTLVFVHVGNILILHRDIGFSDFVHRPETQYLCVLYTIVRTL
jgi:hypothetical protein